MFIIYFDIDAFFPTVEKNRNPKLRNIPIAIGVNKKRSVISSACYIARQYGVRAAMPTYRAFELCPQLKLVMSSHTVYRDVSREFFRFVEKLIPGEMIISSIDEGFAILDKSIDNHEDLYKLTSKIQRVVMEKLSLSISIGISYNTFLAKMANKMAKPHGIYWIYSNEIQTKLWTMPIEDFYGIGRQKWPVLKDHNVLTIGDFARLDPNNAFASKLFGKNFSEYLALARGEASSDRWEHEPKSRSISDQRTFLTDDVDNLDDALHILKKCTLRAWRRMKKDFFIVDTVGISVKQGQNRSLRSHQKKLTNFTEDFNEIFEVVKHLFYEYWDERPLRLLGVSLQNLRTKFKAEYQHSLFDQSQKSDTEKIIDSINQKFKREVVGKLE